MKAFAKGSSLVLAVALLIPLAARADEKGKLIEKRDPEKAPQTDQQFVVKALAGDVAEIKFSENAVKNAENSDVRKFAQRMVDDHTKNKDKLLEIAKTMKVAVVEGLEKGRRTEMVRLMKLKGVEYDREYIRCMIDDHEKALKMYETWSTKAKDSEVRDVAIKAVGVVKGHLRTARDLQAKLKA
jgi:putative membrane protein